MGSVSICSRVHMWGQGVIKFLTQHISHSFTSAQKSWRKEKKNKNKALSINKVMTYSLCKVWPLASGHVKNFHIHPLLRSTHRLGFISWLSWTFDNYPHILHQKGQNVPSRHAWKKKHPHCCLEGTKPSTMEEESSDLEGLGSCDGWETSFRRMKELCKAGKS